jgi:hypothetical protein
MESSVARSALDARYGNESAIAGCSPHQALDVKARPQPMEGVVDTDKLNAASARSADR